MAPKTKLLEPAWTYCPARPSSSLYHAVFSSLSLPSLLLLFFPLLCLRWSCLCSSVRSMLGACATECLSNNGFWAWLSSPLSVVHYCRLVIRCTPILFFFPYPLWLKCCSSSSAHTHNAFWKVGGWLSTRIKDDASTEELQSDSDVMIWEVKKNVNKVVNQ